MKIDNSIKRCAIIGNSPYLLYNDYGSEIDEYEVVFRCNAAITQGFEKYVGSKTDYRLVNIHVCNWLSKLGVQSHEAHLKNLDPGKVITDKQIVVCKDYKLKQDDDFGKRYKNLEWSVKKHYGVDCESYYMPKQALRQRNIWSHVSTGTYATALASMLFPSAEISCYGFSFYENLKEECHYFEVLENKKLCHDFKRDKEEFAKIPKTRVVK